ncbi:unnamed protein product [Clonostachys rosea]|uniref:Uncharacterized protein n=1 Tax=Bionectria ochroleuca TaxID=29856 RepID=A0ABY6U470_BIOOC|nr:unnamed protein product [Clonostachys rosea]
MSGNRRICEALLDHGADPNALSRHMPFAPLELAISLLTDSSEVVEILMKYGADVNMSANWEIEVFNHEFFNHEFLTLGAKFSKRTLVYKAVKTQNIDTTRMLILRGARLNSSSELGGLPIQMAVRNNDLNMVKFLLRSGAKINAPDFDETVGRYGAFYLKENDYSAGYQDNSFDTRTDWWALFSPIQIATQQNNLAMAEYLLNEGANIQQTHNWNTLEEQIPVPQPSSSKRQLYYQILRSSKSRGQSALHHAAENGNIKMTELLLQKGAIVDQTNASGATPLQFVCGMEDDAFKFEAACEEARISSTQIRIQLALVLLNGGSNVNAPPGLINGKTALQAAAERGDDEMVKLLLCYGADIDAPPAIESGLTCLQAAAKSRNLDLLMMICSHGAQLTSDVLFIALYFAALAGDIPLINFVTKRYINTSGLFPVKLASEINGTILQAGVRSGNIEVVRLLLHAKAEINIVAEGETAICTAVRENHLEIFKLLMERGASLYYPTMRITPLAIAVSSGFVDMVENIINAGVDVNQLSHRPGRDSSLPNCSELATPLFWGLSEVNRFALYQNTEYSLLESLETIGLLLLSNGANPNLMPNGYSRPSPLEISCSSMSYTLTEALIDYGADINADNRSGKDILSCAIGLGYEDHVQLLLENGVDSNGSIEVLLDHTQPWMLENDFLIPKFPTERQVIFRMLLNSGARLADEKEMLARAIWVGYDALAWERIEAGDDVDYPFDCGETWWNGITPLQAAIYTRKPDFVRVLLDHDANPNPPKIENSIVPSPLQVAVADGNFNLARLLIEKGADVNTAPGFARWITHFEEVNEATALQYAAMGGYIDIVHLLLENDKDPNTIASRRADASEIAEKGGHALLAQILRGQPQI